MKSRRAKNTIAPAGVFLATLIVSCQTLPPAPETPEPPTADTRNATSITTTGATLTGVVNPRGSLTFYHFEVGITAGHYLTETPEGSVGAGENDVLVSHTGDELEPRTTYHYRLVAVNATDTVRGADRALTTLAAAPRIEIDSASLSFEATQDGAPPPTRRFTITNSGSGTLNWTVSDDAGWLVIAPTSGTGNSAAITASVIRTTLAPGVRTATITVSSANADNTPQTVAVSYTIHPPVPSIALSPSSMSFVAVTGGAVPDIQFLTIANPGGGTLQWDVATDVGWLDADPVTGQSNSATISVGIAGTDLAPGSYTGNVTVTSSNADNSPQSIPVSYTVTEPAPHIALDSASLSFIAVRGGGLPSPKSLILTNSGGGTLLWSTSDDAVWLDVTTAGTPTAVTITATINSSDLPVGVHTATITVSSSNADNSPQTVAVDYTIGEPPPHITLDSAFLSFAAIQGISGSSPKSFTITNTGGGSLQWSVSDDAAWLELSDSVTATKAIITASLTSTNLGVGLHPAFITVSSTNADNSPQTIAVEYTVFDPFKSVVTGTLRFPPGETGTLDFVRVALYANNFTDWANDNVLFSVNVADGDSTLEYELFGIPAGDYFIDAWQDVDGNGVWGAPDRWGFHGSLDQLGQADFDTLTVPQGSAVRVDMTMYQLVSGVPPAGSAFYRSATPTLHSRPAKPSRPRGPTGGRISKYQQ